MRISPAASAAHLLLAVLLASWGLAPSGAAAQLRVGGLAGLASSELGGDDAFGIGPRRALALSGFVEVPVWRGLSLRPGLTYAGKGVEIDTLFQGDIIVDRFARESAWLAIEVLARAGYRSGALEAYAVGGPVLSRELSCRTLVTGLGTAECSSPPGFERHRTLPGVRLGAGAGWRFRRVTALVEATWERDLRSMQEGRSLYHRTLRLVTGLTVSLGAS